MAFPLSALTWLRSDQFEETPEAPATSAEETILDCYLEVYTTESLTDFQLYFGEQLIASQAELAAHDSADFDLTLPVETLQDQVFRITAKEVKNEMGNENTTPSAIRLTLEPEGLKTLETTLWSRGELDLHFTF